MSDSAATMFLAFLLELDKFSLAKLMVDMVIGRTFKQVNQKQEVGSASASEG